MAALCRKQRSVGIRDFAYGGDDTATRPFAGQQAARILTLNGVCTLYAGPRGATGGLKKPGTTRRRFCSFGQERDHFTVRERISYLPAFLRIATAIALVGACRGSTGQPTKTVEFGELHSANRIEVRRPFDRPVTVITDVQKIQTAAEFIQRHRNGWIDVWTGPRAPELMLDFYKGDRFVGEFGISTSYLVAGSLSQNAPVDEIAKVAADLGLQWPPRD